MNTLLAIIVGGLYAAGLYQMLRRSAVKVVLGLALLSHATNLLIFTAAGVTRGTPPLVPEDRVTPPPCADPLPQALILTAIVISFGVLAFSLVLVDRAYDTVGSDDLDQLESTER